MIEQGKQKGWQLVFRKAVNFWVVSNFRSCEKDITFTTHFHPQQLLLKADKFFSITIDLPIAGQNLWLLKFNSNSIENHIQIKF